MKNRESLKNYLKKHERSLVGIFMNWRGYEPLLENEDHAGKSIIPLDGGWVSAQDIRDALDSVKMPRRETFYRHYVKGITQGELAEERGVSQALIWWELKKATEEILRLLVS